MPANTSPPNPLIAALTEALAGASRPSPEDTEVRRLADLGKQYRFLLHPGWPEARWDVPGVFVNDTLLCLFRDFFLNNHGLSLFSTVHGSPLCLWSGDQIRRQFLVDAANMEPVIHGYAARSVAVELAFTSCALKAEHLRDARGNFLLENLARHNPDNRNGVVFTSDLLARHVRENYPNLRLIASVAKADEEDGRGRLDYYRRQAENCDRVVVHPDDNLNFAMLETVENKDKYEIVVNEPCLRNCQARKLHRRMLSTLAQNFFNSELEGRIARLCMENGCSDPGRLLFSQEQRTLMLSDNEIRRLYDLGFRHFKMQRRDQAASAAIVLDLFRLMFNHDPDLNHLVARTFEEFMRMLPRRPGSE